MSVSFARLGLPDPLVRALSKRGITEPFPVQETTIPDALAGRDVSGKAPTGSGKTLAFGLPLLANVEQARQHRPRALILAPTRELAEQIKQELSPLSRSMNRNVFAIYGGVSYGPQKAALRKGVDVLVATPGRLEDLIEQRSVDLRDVDIAVVDEADRMADMGFMPAVRRILDHTSRPRQTLLFSATLDGDIAVLSRDYQSDPVRHEAGTVEPETIDATHHFWLVNRHDRVDHTADLVRKAGRSIVFTRTRHGADRLAKQLGRVGVGAVAMHGGRSQAQRNRALKEFSTGRAQALIATDVAARGIHIDAVASVIHFDPPGDHKDYLHRSGRTGRAGATGTIISLVTGDQQRAVRKMQKDLDLRMPIEEPRLDTLHVEGPTTVEPAHRNRNPKPAPTHRRETSAAKSEAPPTRRKETPRRRPHREVTSDGQSVYVGNLPWGATDADIRDLFGRFGRVHKTTIITNRKTGRSRGFGFVDMPHEAANDAVKELNGALLEGRDLRVRLAHPDTDRN